MMRVLKTLEMHFKVYLVLRDDNREVYDILQPLDTRSNGNRLQGPGHGNCDTSHYEHRALRNYPRFGPYKQKHWLGTRGFLPSSV